MANMRPLDLVPAAYRVGQTVEAVPDNRVDPFDAGDGEDLGELIRNGFRHVAPAFVPRCCRVRPVPSSGGTFRRRPPLGSAADEGRLNDAPVNWNAL